MAGIAGFVPECWHPRALDLAADIPVAEDWDIPKSERRWSIWLEDLTSAWRSRRRAMSRTQIYAAVGEFPRLEAVITAVTLARAAGRKVEAFTPRSIGSLGDVDGWGWLAIPIFAAFGLAALAAGAAITLAVEVALGGMAGAVGPSSIYNGPAFLHEAFVMAGFLSGLTLLLGVLVFLSLPKRCHPVFHTPHFAERRGSRGYVCLLASSAAFDPDDAADFLRHAGAEEVWNVGQ